MVEILNYSLLKYNSINITVLSILKILIIVIITKILVVAIKKVFIISGRRKKINEAEWMMFYIIIKYFIYLLALIYILKIIGIDVTVLVAGSSALLIGFGIGIKQYLYDIFAGMILLFEHKITLGDIIETEDGNVVKITEIGMRYSQGLDRDNVMIIIPNSVFLSNKINFWKENKGKSRFHVDVGVAYGSDTGKVIEVLKEAALNVPKVSKNPEPIVWLTSFGDSSLNFRVHFWSREIFRIEQVKSEVNLEINKLFATNGITIPFPQRDVHLYKTNQIK